jgi:hypothetical protein
MRNLPRSSSWKSGSPSATGPNTSQREGVRPGPAFDAVTGFALSWPTWALRSAARAGSHEKKQCDVSSGSPEQCEPGTLAPLAEKTWARGREVPACPAKEVVGLESLKTPRQQSLIRIEAASVDTNSYGLRYSLRKLREMEEFALKKGTRWKACVPESLGGRLECGTFEFEMQYLN